MNVLPHILIDLSWGDVYDVWESARRVPGDQSVAYVYVVTDNVTDNVGNVGATKQFVGASTLLGLWQADPETLEPSSVLKGLVIVTMRTCISDRVPFYIMTPHEVEVL